MDKLSILLVLAALAAVSYYVWVGAQPGVAPSDLTLQPTSTTLAPSNAQSTSTRIAKTTSTTVAGVVEAPGDIRCFDIAPDAIGDCGNLLGAYYDGWKKECVALLGCGLDGIAPFNTSLGDPVGECVKTCVN